MIHHLVIQWHFTRLDPIEVLANLGQPRVEPAKGRELRRDACGERLGREEGRGREGGGGCDVSEEMLDADFFGFFGFDGSGDV